MCFLAELCHGPGKCNCFLGGNGARSFGGSYFWRPNRHHQTDTGFSKTAVSPDNGSFAFPVLPVGPYRLEVKKDGFASYQQNGIVLTVNQVAQLSVTLQLGEIKEVIQVNESTPQVDTTTGTLSLLVDQRK